MAKIVALKLTDLSNLDRPALIEQWRYIYGTEPPANISRPLLLQALAYRMQEKVHGGLKQSTRRFLKKATNDSTAGKLIAMPTIDIKAGTRLLREWHGVTHEVIIAKKGALYQGKQYRSLSEVARIITGTKWSGPLFFGLKKAAV